MNTGSKNKCVNCNGGEFENYLELRGYSYKRCKACSLVQLVPLPTLAELKVFYDSNYYEYNFDEKSSNIKAETKKQNDIQYHVIERHCQIKETTKFLDYGCGVGAFLDTLS